MHLSQAACKRTWRKPQEQGGPGRDEPENWVLTVPAAPRPKAYVTYQPDLAVEGAADDIAKFSHIARGKGGRADCFALWSQRTWRVAGGGGAAKIGRRLQGAPADRVRDQARAEAGRAVSRRRLRQTRLRSKELHGPLPSPWLCQAGRCRRRAEGRGARHRPQRSLGRAQSSFRAGRQRTCCVTRSRGGRQFGSGARSWRDRPEPPLLRHDARRPHRAGRTRTGHAAWRRSIVFRSHCSRCRGPPSPIPPSRRSCC